MPALSGSIDSTGNEKANGERIRMHIPPVIRLIGAVCFLAILPVTGHALTPAQVFDKVKDSIVVVKTLDAQGEVKAQGSGVLLPSDRVATNCHVVEGGVSYLAGRGEEFTACCPNGLCNRESYIPRHYRKARSVRPASGACLVQ